MKKGILALSLILIATGINASDTLQVRSFRHAGPFPVKTPYLVDSVDIKGKAFDVKGLIDTPVSFTSLKKAARVTDVPQGNTDAIHLLAFDAQNTRFAKASVKVDGLGDYKVFLDGNELKGTESGLEPGTHEFVIKYLTTASGKAGKAPSVKLIRQKGGDISLRTDGGRIFSLDLDTQGISCGGMDLSRSGKFLSLTDKYIQPDGKSVYTTAIIKLADPSAKKGADAVNRVISRTENRVRWMPGSDRYCFTRRTVEGNSLIAADPAEGTESVLCADVPEGRFEMTPDARYLIYTMVQKGPKEGDVHEILVPDDRQPGWRDRSYLARFDLSTGVLQPLTYGHHNAWLCDISYDGRKILFATQTSCLSKDGKPFRPTTLMSLYIMDLATLKTDCLVENDGFIGSAQFSPDADEVLVQGSPEAFGGIGKAVKEGQIPNGYDYQLYLVKVSDKSVRPLTVDFDPSVDNAQWSRYDGLVYLCVSEKDMKKLYRLDVATGEFECLDSGEDYVKSFAISPDGAMLAYSGQSLCNADRAYVLNTIKMNRQLVKDYNVTRLAGVKLGKGDEYEFTSSRGDLINGFYVLPPDFDPAKKYPLIVHYYGGCSPSARYCVGNYSPQMYAAQGYVFYVVNPSGAAGFGQEFAARHVNTAGDVVADDIIEGVEHFCADHPFIDTDHIGCFSASYGGFMTQLLLCKTDMFAAGISHAGISDHTSYWGEGYWGYSYSEISMADSYPWTRKDLYVDRSPLYMADRIHTPLLFIHGSADTNVPVGESIQMFTALKLLGAETAFVVVDGENHHIAEYSKNRQWLRTLFAWFAKYLQEDSTWWDELYTKKYL